MVNTLTGSPVGTKNTMTTSCFIKNNGYSEIRFHSSVTLEGEARRTARGVELRRRRKNGVELRRQRQELKNVASYLHFPMRLLLISRQQLSRVDCGCLPAVATMTTPFDPRYVHKPCVIENDLFDEGNGTHGLLPPRYRRLACKPST
jgi:hypothetical protein